MPVEIKELVIRTTVTSEDNKSFKSISSSNGKYQEDTIQICVNKVLDILKEKNGR